MGCHLTQFLAHVYCGQIAVWMKTPLGMEVNLSPGHSVLDGVPDPAKRTQQPPIFGPCLLWPRSPISATAELVLFYHAMHALQCIVGTFIVTTDHSKPLHKGTVGLRGGWGPTPSIVWTSVASHRLTLDLSCLHWIAWPENPPLESNSTEIIPIQSLPAPPHTTRGQPAWEVGGGPTPCLVWMSLPSHRLTRLF